MTRDIDEPIVLPPGRGVSKEYLLSIGYVEADRHIPESLRQEFLSDSRQPTTLMTINFPPRIPMTPKLPKHSVFIPAIDWNFFAERKFANGVAYYPLTKLYEEVPAYLALRQRAALERNTQYRQILPYKVISQRGEDGVVRIIAYRRLKSGGESRLYGLMSIGFGGHIDFEDIVTYPGASGSQERSTINLEGTVRQSSKREIGEEVHYLTKSGGPVPFDPEIDSIIPSNLFIHYDLRDKLGTEWSVEKDVHSVHVAFVYWIKAPEGLEFVSGEPDQIEMLPPMTVKELLAKVKSGEYEAEEWTRLLLEFMENAETQA